MFHVSLYLSYKNTELFAFWFCLVPYIAISSDVQDEYIYPAHSCLVFAHRQWFLCQVSFRTRLKTIVFLPQDWDTLTFAIDVRSSQVSKPMSKNTIVNALREVNRLLPWWSLDVCKKGICKKGQGSNWGKYTNCLNRTYVRIGHIKHHDGAEITWKSKQKFVSHNRIFLKIK